MGNAKLGQPRSAELPLCARALAEVATSVGAVALANAALALETDDEVVVSKYVRSWQLATTLRVACWLCSSCSH